MNSKCEYDVAVAGGGIAGVAAAIQAARSGARTVLIEKTILWGGLATSGLINVYLPLCDGNGKQVSFGITEELLRASLKYGPGDIPENWQNEKNGQERKRFISVFQPAAFVLSMDEMLQEAGVDVWLDSVVCAAVTENNRITALEIENESGRIRLSAKQFIDASGSAVLARRLNMPLETTANYLSTWVLQFKDGSFDMNYGAVYGDGNPTQIFSDELLETVGLSQKKLSELEFHGISGRQVTQYIMESRRYMRAYYQYHYEKGLGDRKSLYPVKLPIMAQYRKICAIHAKTVMRDGEDWMQVPDSIGLVADWRRAGSVWEVPYSSLYSEEGPENLLFAGRCMGAVGDAWEVMRVIPSAAVTGQAAGLAAALAVQQNNISPRVLEYGDLKNELYKMNIPLHFSELPLTVPEDKK
ncbi:MAG: FAD-dependent oxidoreductase [Lentisphaeria bacterium]|nr:FAD-dependent oxidoreductase [Lentisphaeria bacterium]